ncbi:MAG: hypothetical protein R2856_14110 [Caldilineaceae bacterium]
MFQDQDVGQIGGEAAGVEEDIEIATGEIDLFGLGAVDGPAFVAAHAAGHRL